MRRSSTLPTGHQQERIEIALHDRTYAELIGHDTRAAWPYRSSRHRHQSALT